MIKFRTISRVGQAVGEQLKSQVAENGLEKGKRGTIATPQQIVGYRRRPENIFASMIKDEWFSKEELNKPSQVKNIIKKKNPHMHKRGTRSAEAIKRRNLKFKSNSRE